MNYYTVLCNDFVTIVSFNAIIWYLHPFPTVSDHVVECLLPLSLIAVMRAVLHHENMPFVNWVAPGK